MSARDRWGPALAIAVLIASAVTIPQATRVARLSRQHVLSFDVWVSKPTTIEVFFDRGRGFVPADSAQVAITPSSTPSTHRVPVGPGVYWAIRVDPFGEAGRLRLENVKIEDRYGVVRINLDPAGFEPSPFVTIEDRSTTGLSATALEGHVDPQITYRFRVPRLFVLSWLEFAYWAGVFYLTALATTLLVGFSGHWLARWHGPRIAWRITPVVAIAGASAAATLVAIYPLLFARTLATPNNGPSAFVYDSPPFVPGSSDLVVEDGRSADTDAAMWVTMPYSRVQREALVNGEFPWWNRRVEGGVPLWGQGQTRLLDPLHWPSLLSNEALGADLSFVAGRFVYATGAGLAAFAASGSLPAALWTALGTPFAGHFIARLNDPGYFAIVYAPWVLWAYGLLALADTGPGRARASVALSVATMLGMFASPPKEAVAVLAGVHVAGLAALGVAWWRGRRGRLVWALGSLASAALLTAPQWLVFLETLHDAQTVYEAGAVEYAGRLHLAAFWLGNLSQPLPPGGLNLLVAPALAAAILAWRRVLVSPLACGCAIASVAIMAVALGAVPEVWLLKVPLVRQIHHVGRSGLIAAAPLVIVMVAPGIAALASPTFSWRAVHGCGLVASAVALGAVLVAADFDQPTAEPGLIAAIWGSTWPYFYRLSVTGLGGLMGMLGTVTVTAVLLLPGGLHLSTGRAWLDEVLVQPRMRVDLTARPAELEMVARTNAEPFRVAGTHRVFGAGVPAHSGFETITGFEALASPYARALGTVLAPTYPSALPLSSPALESLLDAWGVRFSVAAPSTSDRRPLVVTDRAGAWPRAFFADRVAVHDGVNGFADTLLQGSGPMASVDRGDEAAVEATRTVRGVQAIIQRASDYRLTPNTTTFTVEAPGAGVVVLGESYWPGMRATINGQDAEVFRINHAMRGVRIDGPGRWVVRFWYRPRLAWLAAAGAAAGAFLLGGLAVLARR
jgi:hypothetical protein